MVSSGGSWCETNTFSFAGLELRCVTIEGQPWFVAGDVCRMLGLSLNAGATRHLTNLKSSEVKTHRLPGTAGKPNAIISESGLYKLVMRSDKPQAREFQNWVTKTVLPAIRQTACTCAVRRSWTSRRMPISP